jgi:acetyl-CoA carboxylase biotin carboxyl carrier protein
MNQKELKELIEFLIEKDIAEFELERGDFKVRVKRGHAIQVTGAGEPHFTHVPVAAPPPAATVHYPPPVITHGAALPAAQGEEGLHYVKSPIVGTFYEAPSPGAPPFIKVGDTVTDGQILCIIEAMKLMNEIESDAAGEIVKVLVSNGQPVEYGQPLFALRAK